MTKKVAILGFGVEGRDSAAFFAKKKNVEITVFDKKEKKDLRFTIQDLRMKNINKVCSIGINKVCSIGINKVCSIGIKWVLGKDYLHEGLKDFDLVVRSPGFYRYHPRIIEAQKAGVEITSNTNIFFAECKKPIIAVTGTKGKGTVVRMLALALKKAGLKTLVAGNIGEPTLALLPKANLADWVILELSSFQTIDLDKSPHIVVVTNITIDHLNWHKNREEYVRAKAQLWKNQTKNDFLVLNWNDKTSRLLAKEATGQVLWFNKGEKLPEGLLKVPGEHNLRNAQAGLTAAEAAGVARRVAWRGITSYKGSEHRLERVDRVGGVTYINDSASTNPEATIAALQSFKEDKILIAGGSSKGVGFKQMAKEIIFQNTKAVLLLGQTSKQIADRLKEARYKGFLKTYPNLKQAVGTARKIGKKGNVVLLSPGCASFGMFANYEERGEAFKKEVKLTAQRP